MSGYNGKENKIRKGDIVFINESVTSGGLTISGHPFYVTSDKGGDIDGVHYDFIGCEISSQMNKAKKYRDNYVLYKGEKRQLPLDEYKDWIEFGMSLSSLGDSGLEFFKRISRFSKKYDEQKTESVFSDLKEKTREIGIGTFFFKCTKLGIIPDCVAHYECIPFPVEVFPAKAQEIVRETAEHNNFPPGCIAPAMLFVACLACGNAAVVEIINGWREKPLLYLGIVGCRGTNKSSSLEFALDPIRKKEDEEYDKFVELKEKYEAELLKTDKKRRKHLRKILPKKNLRSGI